MHSWPSPISRVSGFAAAQKEINNRVQHRVLAIWVRYHVALPPSATETTAAVQMEGCRVQIPFHFSSFCDCWKRSLNFWIAHSFPAFSQASKFWLRRRTVMSPIHAKHLIYRLFPAFSYVIGHICTFVEVKPARYYGMETYSRAIFFNFQNKPLVRVTSPVLEATA